MKFRNLIFILAITFSVIFVAMIGSSYAYYVTTGGVNLNVTTGNIDTGIAVVFSQSQYINVNTGVPITSSQVDSLASSSEFTIIPDSNFLNDYDSSVNISIVDISVDKELRVSDFKYKFICNDGSVSTVLSSGNGTNFTDDVISKGSLDLGVLNTVNGTFNINKLYTCNLNVWLEDNGANQNHLMNKMFRGLIRVNTLFKKK